MTETHPASGPTPRVRGGTKHHHPPPRAHLLQLMVTSSGRTLLFSIPLLGWSPRPRNNPGGSVLKLPIFSRCPSKIQ